MPTFEFEVGNQVYEIDAANQAEAAAKFRNLRTPAGTPTPTEWGPADRPKPAPGHRPGPLGDLSTQGALQGAFTASPPMPSGAPVDTQQSVAGQPPLPTPPADAPSVSTGSIKPPVLGPGGFSAALEDAPLPDRIIGGVGSAVMKAKQSLQQLLGRDPTETEIREWRAVSEGPGMVGDVAGNLLMLGAPLGAAERALAGVSAAGKEAATIAPVLRRTLAGMGIAGTEGALLNPTLEGESRLTNALKNAVGAGAIGLGGRLLTGLVRPSKEGAAMMERGVQPTVGQGGGGTMGTALGYAEELANSIPILEKAIARNRAKAEKGAIDVAARRGSPYGASQETVGSPEFFAALNKHFDDAYDQLLKGKRIPYNRDVRLAVRDGIDKAKVGISERAANQLEKDAKQFFPQLSGISFKGDAWRSARDNIIRLKNKYAQGAEDNVADAKGLHAGYQAMEDALNLARNKVLSPDEIKRFDIVDTADRHRKILEAAGDTGDVNMGTLADAAAKAATKGTTRLQTGDMQDLTGPGTKVFEGNRKSDSLGRRIGNYVAASALGAGSLASGTPIALPLYLAAGLLGSTKTGAKLTMGNTQIQRRLADLLRGRAGTTAAVIDSAWE